MCEQRPLNSTLMFWKLALLAESFLECFFTAPRVWMLPLAWKSLPYLNPGSVSSHILCLALLPWGLCTCCDFHLEYSSSNSLYSAHSHHSGFSSNVTSGRPFLSTPNCPLCLIQPCFLIIVWNTLISMLLWLLSFSPQSAPHTGALHCLLQCFWHWTLLTMYMCSEILVKWRGKWLTVTLPQSQHHFCRFPWAVLDLFMPHSNLIASVPHCPCHPMQHSEESQLPFCGPQALHSLSPGACLLPS